MNVYALAGARTSHTPSKILDSIPDERERVDVAPSCPSQRTATLNALQSEAGGGLEADSPESVQKKVEAARVMTSDDAVAAAVTADFLYHPAVASKGITDDYLDYAQAA